MFTDFYVYAHYVNETDEHPKYIGKGRANRAYSKQSRSKAWKNVFKDGFYIRFFATDVSEDEAVSIETEAIVRYKSLVPDLLNIVNGGGGKSRPDVTAYWKELIKQTFAETGRFPSSAAYEDRPLYTKFSAYLSKTNGSFDPEFRAWAEENGYARDVQDVKEEIKQFFSKNNRFPSRQYTEEKRLCWAYKNYIREGGPLFDKEFREWCLAHGTGNPKNKGRPRK
jgi:hypothetical protein